ncbi:MAG: alpha/beta hydrolase [Kofleriaceae bacterium]|nr:alpha/beta hydrolase [Kofleriaceae bacterium]MBP6837807.1 alpha/beta hydrolase [Kofleriaceae bacterium]
MTAPSGRRLPLHTGLTYQVWTWGAASAPTVLLLHGFLDHGRGWTDVAAALAERYFVVAPDLRGHGDSDWIGPGGYYHFFDYVADVDALVDALAADRSPLHVVGHSMGGTIAGYWAGARPDRCRRLALLEGLGPPESDVAPPVRVARWLDGWRAARAAPTRALPDLAAAAARLRHHDPLLSAEVADRLAAWGTRPVAGGVAWKHDPLHLTAGPYPFRREVAAALWRNVTCPVLVVDGAASTLRLAQTESADRLACFADARTAVLPHAGHMMQRHQPAALAELLGAFLS